MQVLLLVAGPGVCGARRDEAVVCEAADADGGWVSERRVQYVGGEGVNAERYLEATWNCNDCPFWRARNHKRPGVLIPRGQRAFGIGKCIRPQGHCSPRVTRRGIGRTG